MFIQFAPQVRQVCELLHKNRIDVVKFYFYLVLVLILKAGCAVIIF